MARQAELLSVEEARRRILEHFHPVEAENVPLGASHERVLADDIMSSSHVPPFANSSMDGFALLSADTATASAATPLRLPVSAVIAAGSTTEGGLSAGTAARIMTGGPVPAGADTVVPFEQVIDHGGSIELFAPVPTGACVRSAGQDIVPGVRVLEQGTVLQARHLAVLASIGIADVPVRRTPRIGILSTGNELVPPGRPLASGQIYNSNTPMLVAAVEEAGGQAQELETVRDDAAGILTALRAVGLVDLLVTTGGASVGDFDYMTDVVGASGEVRFWRVRVRPGKPLLFGTVDATPIIALPGNPTSAMVTFELFVRPAIRALLGAHLSRPSVQASVAEHFENGGGRRTYARVQVTWNGHGYEARASGPQDSAMVLPLARADGLLEIPEDVAALAPGMTATVFLW